MAATTATTLGTRRAVLAPSRRQFGGASLAALCGAAFAGAVVLPDPGEASLAQGVRIPRTPSQLNPDTAVLDLCAEFFRVNTSVEAVPDDDALALVMEARDALAQRISTTRAITAAGLQAKARVGCFLMNERRCPGEPLDDVDSYSLALMGELAAGSVEPLPLAVGRDAELIRLCAECDALQHQADALWTGSTRIEDDAARDLLLRPLEAAQDPLLARICKLSATTPQGQGARARTYLGWDQDPPWESDDCWDSQLLGAIVRDLAAVA